MNLAEIRNILAAIEATKPQTAMQDFAARGQPGLRTGDETIGAQSQDLASTPLDDFSVGLGEDRTESVPPYISNMVPENELGILQGAESVGADETHVMPDGTVHPYPNHEEMMRALRGRR